MTVKWHMYSKIQIMKRQVFSQLKAAKSLGIHRTMVKLGHERGEVSERWVF